MKKRLSGIDSIAGRFPLLTFLVALAILFVAIYASKFVRDAALEEQAKEVARQEAERGTSLRSVEIFDDNETAYATVLGEVDRADTITLVATKGGIVSRALGENAYVYRGGEIAYVADTYGGVSQAGAASALAKRTLEYQQDIHGDQKKVLKYQKKDLNKTDRNTVKIARKQITLQEKANDYNLDSAKLQAQQAYAAAAVARISAPFTGRIQSAFIRPGDTVNAGQAIAVLKAQNERDAQIVAYVGKSRAATVDLNDRAYAVISGEEIELEIIHIASAPTEAGAYAVTLSQSHDAQNEIQFEDGAFVTVHLPLSDDENERIIPLDAVRYGAGNAEVYVLREEIATPVSVTLGTVIGSYVVIQGGIAADDMVILDRNVSAGEQVTTQQ